MTWMITARTLPESSGGGAATPGAPAMITGQAADLDVCRVLSPAWAPVLYTCLIAPQAFVTQGRP